jgi:hypothetical protein
MKDADCLKDARDQLTLVLSFFPRVDAKLSTVLAVDTGMLAAMTAGVPAIQSISAWSILAASIAAILLIASLLFLYWGAFPSLKGGHSSVIFFKDIAARNESTFLEEYANETPESLRVDVLSQVWRNSEILSEKFRCLKVAFITMACAVVPWCISLTLFAAQRANVKVMVAH